MGTLALNDRVCGPFTAEADQVEFPADFPLLRTATGLPYGILVKRTRAGVATILTSANFTVPEETTGGFTLKLKTAAAAGDILVIYGAMPAERLRTHAPGGSVRTETLEGDAVQMEMQLQENTRDIGRAILVPIGESGFELPSEEERAGNILEFDDDGAPIAIHDIAYIVALATQEASILIIEAISSLSGGDFTTLINAFNAALAAAGAAQVTLIGAAGDDAIAAIEAAALENLNRLPIGGAFDVGEVAGDIQVYLDPAPTEVEVESPYFVLAIEVANSCLGATTITVNDIGPYDLVYTTGGVLEPDAVVAGGVYWVAMTSTGVFQLISVAPPVAAETPPDPSFEIIQTLSTNPAVIKYPVGSDGRRLIIVKGSTAISTDSTIVINFAAAALAAVIGFGPDVSFYYPVNPGGGHQAGGLVARYLSTSTAEIKNDQDAGTVTWTVWGYDIPE